MMQKLWQKNWKLNYSKDVIDIVLFGSAVHSSENATDMDIVVLFKKIPVKEQLEQAQEIKKQIQSQSALQVHIKSFDTQSFFDKGNFAREGILFYGKSILFNKDFSENFGLSPKLRIYYALDKLEKKDKVKFNYLLSGKQGNYGLLRKFGGKIISPGVIETLPENEFLLVEPMKKITKDVRTEKSFILFRD